MEVEKSAKGSYSENADFVVVEKSANGSYGKNADLAGVKKSAKEPNEREC